MRTATPEERGAFIYAYQGLVKENVRRGAPLAPGWLVLALLVVALTHAGLVSLEHWLPAPEPRTLPPDLFSADRAFDFLVNLTDIGPRVAGSYENEVLAMSRTLAALRGLQTRAARGVRVSVEAGSGDGALALDFLDGLNSVYRGVQYAVARLEPLGGGDGPALLLNCHIDTVPDSPGASDDAAGCAVLLEVGGALAARGLRRPVVLLMNGAEENVMQASHAFLRHHRWAKQIRTFINLEACGAGGRELVFQAGPRDAWIMEVYATSVPRPYASSVAQEIFSSGWVPGDTDFRVFRDYGALSGADVAWAGDGYAYHTDRDEAGRLSTGALQRAGDNVLAWARGLLVDERMGAPEQAGRMGVYFDVAGSWLILLSGRSALLLGLVLLLSLAAHVTLAARAGRRRGLAATTWLAALAMAAVRLAAAAGAALATAAVAGVVQHYLAPMAWYRTPTLVYPLFVMPALAAAGLVVGGGVARGGLETRGGQSLRRGLAGGVCAGLLVVGAVWRGSRVVYLPALLLLAPTVGLLVRGLSEQYQIVVWLAVSWLASVPFSELCGGLLGLVGPLLGRAGPVWSDLVLALLATLASLPALLGLVVLLPLVRHRRKVLLGMMSLGVVTAVLTWSTSLGAAYSAHRPQRLMVFHVLRTVHTTVPGQLTGPGDDDPARYWVPLLDDNTADTVRALGEARVTALHGAHGPSSAECSRLVWCGAPYYLPAQSLLPAAVSVSVTEPPAVRLMLRAELRDVTQRTATLRLQLVGAAHTTVLVAPTPHTRLLRCSASAAAPISRGRWLGAPVYFYLLHDAHAAPNEANWTVDFYFERTSTTSPPTSPWTHIAAAAHAQFGPLSRTTSHAALLAALPAWTTATGWGVHEHHLLV